MKSLLLVLLAAAVVVVSTITEGCTLYSGGQTDEQGPQVLCQECGLSGYLNEAGECVCLTPAMDPNDQCLAPGLKNETLLKTWDYYESPCECFHSFEQGFFRLTSPERTKIINGTTQYQWGDGPPPTCSLCFNPYYGPAPTLQTYSSKQRETPIACGRLGGQDPVLLLETPAPTPPPDEQDETGGGGGRRSLDEQFTWSLCAGHGEWNSTFHGCECVEGWGLELVEERGYNNSLIALCQKCQGPWGPLVPSQQNSLPQNLTGDDAPYCGVIYTPDPIDGVLRECGGHGSYFDDGCICDFTSSLGFWVLQTFQQTEKTLLLVGPERYNTSDILYQVQTCQGCHITGDTPPCLQSASPTFSPSSPTQSP